MFKRKKSSTLTIENNVIKLPPINLSKKGTYYFVHKDWKIIKDEKGEIILKFIGEGRVAAVSTIGLVEKDIESLLELLANVICLKKQEEANNGN